MEGRLHEDNFTGEGRKISIEKRGGFVNDNTSFIASFSSVVGKI